MSNQIAAQEESARETDYRRRVDENYANDVNTLAAVFRIETRGASASDFAGMLRYVASLMLDGWGASDAQFPQAVFDMHGPGAVLLALKRAYDSPEHVVSDVVEHP